jgi:UDP-N-acetylmuramate dehydrogenase
VSEEAVAEALRCLPGARARVPLGPLTTYRVGGPAAVLFEARSPADLARAGEAVEASGLPVLVLGRGSNLLVADAGFPGLVVSLGEDFARLELDGTQAVAGGALSYPVLARRTAAAGLGGMEWAVGVPGSVGGGVRMNAGGHGSETSSVLRWARVWDLRAGEERCVGPSQLDYSYRHSNLRADQVVVAACFGLHPADPGRSQAQLAEIVRWRREHQPGGQNAGSVFTNPPNDTAGRLVEAAGLKGYRLGTAQVSTKHANFIQADPGGSADDVAELIATVRRLVAERLGVALDLEVRLAGRFRGLGPPGPQAAGPG